MIGRIAFGVALAASFPAAAALPPIYQRQAELRAIIGNTEVTQKLRNQPIDAIERTAPDVYRVKAGDCRLEVKITNDPAAPQIPGPRQFLLVVGEASCS